MNWVTQDRIMSTQKRHCCCNWTNCEIFRDIILEKSNDNHEWKGQSIRIQFPEMNPSKMADKNLLYLNQ